LEAKRIPVRVNKARLFSYLACNPTQDQTRLRYMRQQVAGGNGCFGGEVAEVKAPEASLLLRQRMQVAHQALEPFLDHMGVDLRGRDVGMAEQRLNDAQIGAVVQKMAGEGVAQHMR